MPICDMTESCDSIIISNKDFYTMIESLEKEGRCNKTKTLISYINLKYEGLLELDLKQEVNEGI